jgi:hypothetical protein
MDFRYERVSENRFYEKDCMKICYLGKKIITYEEYITGSTKLPKTF